MTYYFAEDELCHYGVKGMKWGVRRYQNEDGSLTEEGKKKYAVNDYTTPKQSLKAFRKLDKMGANVEFEQNRIMAKNARLNKKQWKQAEKMITARNEKKRAKASAKLEKVKAEIEKNNKAFGDFEVSKTNISSNQWRHVANLISKNMDVTVKKRAEYAANGKAYARVFLYGTLPGLMISNYTGDASIVQRNSIKARQNKANRDPLLRVKS